jgi:hypothetical protein
MLALTLLVLAAAPASPPAAPDEVFAGCQASPVQGGGMWSCQGFMASIADISGAGVEVAADAHFAGMKASIKGELAVKPTTFTAGGKSWPARAFSVTRPPETRAVFEGVMLAFEAPNGAVRLITCGSATGGPGGKRCPGILAHLAESGPPASMRPGPDAKAMFVDVELPVPKGCTLTEASPVRFQLTCGETAFLSYFRLQTPDELPNVEKLVSSQLIKGVPGAKEKPAKACKLGGVKTRCSIIESEDAVFYLASAVVRGAPVSLHCGQEKSRPGFHPVCAKLFSWK